MQWPFYEKDSRYKVKKAEARGERDLDTMDLACRCFLRERVLVKGQYVLDLGCAAGAALKTLTELGGHGKRVTTYAHRKQRQRFWMHRWLSGTIRRFKKYIVTLTDKAIVTARATTLAALINVASLAIK
jgi:hypothetical protein